MNEKEKQSHAEVFRMMAENPELLVVPMVDGEALDDDGCRWAGSWGNAYIDEYITGGGRIYFRDDEDVEEVIIGVLGRIAYNAMSNEEAEAAYQTLPWVKAIIVNIDLP